MKTMFAVTPRLLLGPAGARTRPALLAAIADARVVCNLAQAPWPYTLADAEAFLQRERPVAEAACLIFLRDGDAPRLIGGVGFGRSPGCGARIRLLAGAALSGAGAMRPRRAGRWSTMRAIRRG